MLGLALLATALAAPPVVYTAGPTETAHSRVAHIIGRDDLVVHSLVERLGGLPLQLDGHSPTPCGDPPTRLSELLSIQVALQGHVNYVRLEEATKELAQVRQLMACLGESLDPAVGARIFFLGGVVHAQLGDLAAADGSFRQALIFDPELAWDPQFSPAQGMGRFEAVVATKPAKHNLKILPAAPAALLRLDGIPVESGSGAVSLPSGPHLLQVERDSVRSYWFDVQDKDLALSLPALATDSSWINATEKRDDLLALLALVEPIGSEIYLVGDQVWLGHAGSPGSTPVQPPPPVWTRGLAGVGLAAAVIGGGAALGIRTAAKRLADGCDNATGSDPYAICEENFGTYSSLYPAWVATSVVAGVGVLAGGAGLALGRLMISPVPAPGGGIVLISTRR
jgi:hypothetical protein